MNPTRQNKVLSKKIERPRFHKWGAEHSFNRKGIIDSSGKGWVRNLTNNIIKQQRYGTYKKKVV
jgi:hypothetical protein